MIFYELTEAKYNELAHNLKFLSKMSEMLNFKLIDYTVNQNINSGLYYLNLKSINKKALATFGTEKLKLEFVGEIRNGRNENKFVKGDVARFNFKWFNDGDLATEQKIIDQIKSETNDVDLSKVKCTVCGHCRNCRHIMYIAKPENSSSYCFIGQSCLAKYIRANQMRLIEIVFEIEKSLKHAKIIDTF